MKIKGKYVIRQIADETVAIPVNASGDGFYGIISLNGVGKFLFELLGEERTEAGLVSALLEEYDVAPETARADVQEFVEQLRKAGLLAGE